jgi:hypothetical protein
MFLPATGKKDILSNPFEVGEVQTKQKIEKLTT